LNVLKGSALGKAVTYALNQKKYMENYLLDGRCSISNNAAENAIRPFTVGRKNWLFADTPKGASASAAVYSIVETAKANRINVYTYLQYLLLYMPDTDWRNYPEELDQLMPWSKAIQAECK
jgi:transposase IS66